MPQVVNDTPPNHIILATDQPVFPLNYHIQLSSIRRGRFNIYNCQALDEGDSTTNQNSLVRLGWESNPGPGRYGANALATTRLAHAVLV